jgi:soluble P-type ATPase
MCHSNLRRGIAIEIPGFGPQHVTTVVSDFTGTLSFGGLAAEGVKEKLKQLIELVELHVITADSFGTARDQLAGIAEPHLLTTARQDVEKAAWVSRFSLSNVAALGNGNNDRLMLQRLKEGGGLAIAVDNGEGCATDALLSSHLLVTGVAHALDLLLEPTRLKATLRF